MINADNNQLTSLFGSTLITNPHLYSEKLSSTLLPQSVTTYSAVTFSLPSSSPPFASELEIWSRSIPSSALLMHRPHRHHSQRPPFASALKLRSRSIQDWWAFFPNLCRFPVRRRSKQKKEVIRGLEKREKVKSKNKEYNSAAGSFPKSTPWKHHRSPNCAMMTVLPVATPPLHWDAVPS